MADTAVIVAIVYISWKLGVEEICRMIIVYLVQEKQDLQGIWDEQVLH